VCSVAFRVLLHTALLGPHHRVPTRHATATHQLHGHSTGAHATASRGRKEGGGGYSDRARWLWARRTLGQWMRMRTAHSTRLNAQRGCA
jgi:hypothetical protein